MLGSRRTNGKPFIVGEGLVSVHKGRSGKRVLRLLGVRFEPVFEDTEAGRHLQEALREEPGDS